MNPDKVQTQFSMLTPFNEGEVRYILKGMMLINSKGVYLYKANREDGKQASSIASKLKEVGVTTKQIMI